MAHPPSEGSWWQPSACGRVSVGRAGPRPPGERGGMGGGEGGGEEGAVGVGCRRPGPAPAEARLRVACPAAVLLGLGEI